MMTEEEIKRFLEPFTVRLKKENLDITFKMDKFYRTPSLAARDTLKNYGYKGIYRYIIIRDSKEPADNYLILQKENHLSKLVDLSENFIDFPYIGENTIDFKDVGPGSWNDLDYCPGLPHE